MSPRLLLPLFVLLSSGLARAQNLTLSATPEVVGPDGLVTLHLPASAASSNTKFRIGLFERNRLARLADVSRAFAPSGTELLAQVRVEAPPGRYEFRLLSNNKNRAPLSLSAPILVPGIDREPGWWLFNGSPFVAEAPGGASNLPLFLPGLARDRNKKPKAPRDIPLPSAALSWKTLPLVSFEEMAQPGFDFGSLRARIFQVAGAGRGFIGLEVDGRVQAELSSAIPSNEKLTALMRSLRDVTNTAAPGAALLLNVDASPSGLHLAASSGGEFDALIVPSSDLWAVKIARRMAEEQPNFDLPIFVRDRGDALEAWMSGATGIIGDVPAWAPLFQRNMALWVGSVTLEDAGVLPQAGAARLPELLKRAGRIPLLARPRDPEKKNPPESFLVDVEGADAALLDSIRLTADAGATIYVEGAAPAALADKAKFLGGTLSPVERAASSVTLDDPWLWGTLAGQKLPVEQGFKVTLGAASLVRQTKDEKGKDVLLAPQTVATLEDGSPAIVRAPVGKGEILWMPHRLTSPQDALAARFYDAVAGTLQPALVRLRPAPDTTAPAGAAPSAASAEGVRVAMRRSPLNALLLGLFNPSNTVARVVATVPVPAGVALDLTTERELPVSTRGGLADVTVSIPANGYALIAFSSTRKALDDERLAKRVSAKLR